jgi:hypothetical protein
METKIGGKRVEKLASRLGMAGSFAVDSDGLSGGICCGYQEFQPESY